MTSDDLQHLAAAYALDALSDDERRAFERDVLTQNDHQAEVRANREVAARLASAAAAPPPEELRANVLAEISQTPQLSTRVEAEPDAEVIDLSTHRRRLGAGVLAVAAAMVLVVGLLAIQSGTDAIEEVIAAADAEVVTLDGEAGDLQLVWSDDLDQIALLANQVPTVGEDEQYQLWFVFDDETVASAGVFDPDDDGQVRTLLDVGDGDGRPPVAWGVTIEPSGGSPQPTSDIVYVGSA